MRETNCDCQSVNSLRKKLVGFVQTANSEGEDLSEMSKDIDMQQNHSMSITDIFFCCDCPCC
jgi:hypothetical protein